MTTLPNDAPATVVAGTPDRKSEPAKKTNNPKSGKQRVARRPSKAGHGPKRRHKPAKTATAAKASYTARAARQGSKTARVLDLLQRPTGATLKELMKTTGWQAHSVRGFLSGTVGKKMRLTVVSLKEEDGERRYSLKV